MFFNKKNIATEFLIVYVSAPAIWQSITRTANRQSINCNV